MIDLKSKEILIKQLTNKDALLDIFYLFYKNTILDNSTQENKTKFIELYKPVFNDKSRFSLKDFKVMNNKCAIGAFGKVTIVQSNRNNKIYAMKTSPKSKLIHQSNHSSPMEERFILSLNDDWLPSLYCSFQDDKNIYLVMEYIPGGDLQGLLERRDYKPLNEFDTRFYISELILAIDRVHKLGFIHRDIKPGNILIDAQGHIKLADLGSCISIETKDELSMVGTLFYCSPEMSHSEGHDHSKGPAYGLEVDWWSLGVILYELLFGKLPFNGSNLQIQMALLDPNLSIEFDSTIPISFEAKDLISKLLLKSKSKRLQTVNEIKAHPFFKSVDWDNIKSTKPPFIPPLQSPSDDTFFSATHEDYIDDWYLLEEDENLPYKHYPFIGYSYTQSSDPSYILQTQPEQDQLLLETKLQHTQSEQDYQTLQQQNHILQTQLKQAEQDRLLLETKLQHTQLEQAEQNRLLLETKLQLQHTQSEQDYQTLQQQNHILQTQLEQAEQDRLLLETKLQHTQLEQAEQNRLLLETKLQLQHTQSEQPSQILQHHTQPELDRYQAKVQQLETQLSTLTDRSILNALWERDRRVLKQTQDALQETKARLEIVQKKSIQLEKELKSISTAKLNRQDFSKKDILDRIEKEKMYIKSTERTIQARQKWFRKKDEMDKELKISLDRANSTISVLEEKLKHKFF